MVTTVGTERNLKDLLTDLIELDYDAAEAYQAAIERLGNPEFRERVAAFGEDHLRHVTELGECLAELGHTPPQGGGAKRLLTRGKVAVGALLGDKAILRALLGSEGDTVIAYERAAGFAGAPPEMREALADGRADEHRHQDWLAATLERLD